MHASSRPACHLHVFDIWVRNGTNWLAHGPEPGAHRGRVRGWAAIGA